MPDNVRIDLNQTLKYRLIERYGPKVGRKIAEAIQECIVEGYRGKDLQDCIKGKIQNLIDTGKVTNANLDGIVNLMSQWVTVG